MADSLTEGIFVQKRGIAGDCHGCERFAACTATMNQSAEALASKVGIPGEKIMASAWGQLVTIEQVTAVGAEAELTDYTAASRDWRNLLQLCGRNGGGAELYKDGNKSLICGAE